MYRRFVSLAVFDCLLLLLGELDAAKHCGIVAEYVGGNRNLLNLLLIAIIIAEPGDVVLSA